MSRNSDIKQSMGKGVSVLLLSTIIVKLIGALFKIPLASSLCLGDLGFGYFSSAYDLYTPIYMLAISAFPIAISRIIASFSEQNNQEKTATVFFTAKRLLLPLGLLGSLLFLALVFPIAGLADKTGEGIYAYVAIAPSLLLCCAISCYRGYYEGHCNMLPSAVSNIIEALRKLILGFGFAFVTVTATKNFALAAAAALCGITAGQLAAVLYLRIKFKANQVIKKKEFDRNIAKALIAAAIPAVLVSLSGSLVSLIDTALVRAQLNGIVNDNYELLAHIYSGVLSEYNAKTQTALLPGELPTLLYGIRSKAFTLYNLVPTLTTAIGVSATPVVAGLLSKGDDEGVRHSVGRAIKLASLIAFPAGFGFLVVGKNIMALLYGQGPSAECGGTMLSLYGIAVIFSGLSIPLCCLLQALKKGRAVLLNVCIGIAVKIAVNLILTSMPRINVYGAVIGTVACFTVICILHFITLKRALGKIGFILALTNGVCGSAALCGLVAAAIVRIGNSSLVTLLAIAVAVVVYVAALALFKALDEEDILSLPCGNLLLKVCKKLKIVR